jgi:hypothetical protein
MIDRALGSQMLWHDPIYSQGKYIADRFNAVVYRERSFNTDVEDARRFVRELVRVALKDQRAIKDLK